MTIWVRDRFSATRSLWVSPTFSLLAFRDIGSAPLDGALGRHANAARGDDEFAFLVAIFRDAFAEGQLAGTLAFALPGVAGLGFHRQYVARAQRAVIFEMLLGMQAATAGRAFGDAAGRLAGAEPGLARPPAQRIVRIELRHRLREGGRRDDATDFGLLRCFGVVVDRIVVADCAGEQHDVTRLNGEGDLRQGFPPVLTRRDRSLPRRIAGAQRRTAYWPYATPRSPRFAA